MFLGLVRLEYLWKLLEYPFETPIKYIISTKTTYYSHTLLIINSKKSEKKPPLDNPPQKFIKKSSLSYAILKRDRQTAANVYWDWGTRKKNSILWIFVSGHLLLKIKLCVCGLNRNFVTNNHAKSTKKKSRSNQSA